MLGQHISNRLDQLSNNLLLSPEIGHQIRLLNQVCEEPVHRHRILRINPGGKELIQASHDPILQPVSIHPEGNCLTLGIR